MELHMEFLEFFRRVLRVPIHLRDELHSGTTPGTPGLPKVLGVPLAS